MWRGEKRVSDPFLASHGSWLLNGAILFCFILFFQSVSFKTSTSGTPVTTLYFPAFRTDFPFYPWFLSGYLALLLQVQAPRIYTLQFSTGPPYLTKVKLVQSQFNTFFVMIFQVLSQGSSPLAFLQEHIKNYVECVKDSDKEGCSTILNPPKRPPAKGGDKKSAKHLQYFEALRHYA